MWRLRTRVDCLQTQRRSANYEEKVMYAKSMNFQVVVIVSLSNRINYARQCHVKVIGRGYITEIAPLTARIYLVLLSDPWLNLELLRLYLSCSLKNNIYGKYHAKKFEVVYGFHGVSMNQANGLLSVSMMLLPEIYQVERERMLKGMNSVTYRFIYYANGC